VYLLNASGCLDALTAPDVAGSLDVFVTKTVTPEPRQGNAPTRIAETDFGMLTAIGLANPGRDVFLRDVLACGPEPMLEPVRALAPVAKLAWEAPMACGNGS
jgi:dihydroorotate dehydrogenase